MPVPETSALKVRLDKWLWAARFYKTRSLASEAVNGGKVRVNGTRPKASRTVQVGDRLELSKADFVVEVLVEQLSAKRGPAPVAQTLYRETEQSISRREAYREQRRISAASAPAPAVRPNKRDRRRIVRFTGKGHSE